MKKILVYVYVDKDMTTGDKQATVDDCSCNYN